MTEAAHVRELRDELEALGERYLELLRLVGPPRLDVQRELADNNTRRAALHQAIAAAMRPTGGAR